MDEDYKAVVLVFLVIGLIGLSLISLELMDTSMSEDEEIQTQALPPVSEEEARAKSSIGFIGEVTDINFPISSRYDIYGNLVRRCTARVDVTTSITGIEEGKTVDVEYTQLVSRPDFSGTLYMEGHPQISQFSPECMVYCFETENGVYYLTKDRKPVLDLDDVNTNKFEYTEGIRARIYGDIFTIPRYNSDEVYSCIEVDYISGGSLPVGGNLYLSVEEGDEVIHYNNGQPNYYLKTLEETEIPEDTEDETDDEIVTYVRINTDSAGLARNGIPYTINFADIESEIHIGTEGTNITNNDGEGETGNIVDIYPDVIYAEHGDTVRISISVDPEDSINTACFDDLEWDKQILELKYLSRGDLFSDRFIWIDHIDEYEFTWGSRSSTTEKGTFGTFVFEVIGGEPDDDDDDDEPDEDICPFELNELVELTGEVEPDCDLIQSLNEFVDLFEQETKIHLTVKKQDGTTEIIEEDIEGELTVDQQILWYQIKTDVFELVDSDTGDDVEMVIEIEIEGEDVGLLGVEGLNLATLAIAIAVIIIVALVITRKKWE